jgi:NADH:ubiquinone oxidoreductase subunit 2 (subunit N)
MYMYEPEGDLTADVAPAPVAGVAVAAAVTLVLGVLPGLLVGLLDKASVLRW